MKRIFPPRRRARAIAQTTREDVAFDRVALAIAIWLSILIASQLLIRLPTLPQLSGAGPWPPLNMAQVLNVAGF